MISFTCAHCGGQGQRATGGYNRSVKNGWPLYCSRQCTFDAKRTGRGPGWHERRFVPQDGAIETACAECGRGMWLPPSKVAGYKRCGPACNAAWRKRERDKLVRPCEVCGKEFRPRPIQIANGGGRYCSQRCNPIDHLIAPAALAKAQQAKRDGIAAGTVVFPKGPENKQWMGGPKAALARRVESGKAAASTRAYRAANPHKLREWKQRRGNGKVLPRLPWGTIPRLGNAQRWKCAICRVNIRKDYHLDHIMPIARGGKHEPRNLQLLCPTCNVRKSAKDPISYMQEVGRLL